MFKNIVKKLISTTDTKMVIVIRSDLNMGKGKIASQAAHAAVTLYDLSLKSTNNPYLNPWLRAGQPKIVLKADSCETLRQIYETVSLKKITACKIFDAGKTQIDVGTLTAVGIGPAGAKDIDSVTKDLKLL